MKTFNILAYLAISAAVAAHPADTSADGDALGASTDIASLPTPGAVIEGDDPDPYENIVSALEKIATAIGELAFPSEVSADDSPTPTQTGSPPAPHVFNVHWTVTYGEWIRTRKEISDKTAIFKYRIFDQKNDDYLLEIESGGYISGRNYTFRDETGQEFSIYVHKPGRYSVQYHSEKPTITHLKDVPNGSRR